MSGEPSPLPLSAIKTSPLTPISSREDRALSMQRPTVLASFKQGMTTVTSSVLAVPSGLLGSAAIIDFSQGVEGIWDRRATRTGPIFQCFTNIGHGFAGSKCEGVIT